MSANVESAAIVRTVPLVADVAVPLPVRKTFAYGIPEPLRAMLRVGCRVNVPFGSRLLTGFVVAFDPEDAPAELKPLHSIVDTEPLVDDAQLQLTRWIADRTLCSWGEALRAALPGHAPPRREKIVSLTAPVPGDLFGERTPESLEDKVLSAVGETREVALPRLAKKLGMRVADVKGEVQRLARSGRLRVAERVVGRTPTGAPRIKVVHLTDAALAPSEPGGGGVAVAAEATLARAPVQTRTLEMIRDSGGEIPLRDLATTYASRSPS
jgi:primosomal protein N' (replication factor Y)